MLLPELISCTQNGIGDAEVAFSCLLTTLKRDLQQGRTSSWSRRISSHIANCFLSFLWSWCLDLVIYSWKLYFCCDLLPDLLLAAKIFNREAYAAFVLSLIFWSVTLCLVWAAGTLFLIYFYIQPRTWKVVDPSIFCVADCLSGSLASLSFEVSLQP
jgi:hypothetical protein